MERDHQPLSEFDRIWEDQAAFNAQLRSVPHTEEDRTRLTKDFVLYLESELHELLRLQDWKGHRRTEQHDNPAHRHEELVDAFKILISLCQYQGMESPDMLFSAYWLKTAVVKHRYQEEWKGTLQRPCAVIDIDNVLCDYVRGFCDWLFNNEYLLKHRQPNVDWQIRLVEIRDAGPWINAKVLGVTEEDWQQLKHGFRISGGKRVLPVYPDARPFLDAVRRRNLQIVLLTSRPVDRYPNLYSDTLAWLSNNDLPFDYIWWANDKAEKVVEADIRKHIRLIVDDDPKFIRQYGQVGLNTYWLDRRATLASVPEGAHRIDTLQGVIRHYDNWIQQQEAETWHPNTPTQSIDPTPSTPANHPTLKSPEAPSHS